MAYKDIVPIGSALIIATTSFILGAVYGNLPYDIGTLWSKDETGAAFANSLAHYQTWGNTPNHVHYIFHFVLGLGLLGCFIKLYKPQEDAKYFEYGTLGFLMIAIIIYLTNLRVGVNSAISGNWGEVDAETGLNVMAASQVMIVLVLLGVFVLQGGLYYAEWYDERLKEDFYKKEAEIAASAAVDAEKKQAEAVGEEAATKSTSTGTETTATTVKKTKRIIRKKV
ncbi:Shr3 amino acid permease chaperone [Scheffersomyces amazonensis]|uniref:Shr3 amino acid permease chaperone n=1 Tax=Scheffersomyces amazonensis TaxID=1078765 RepID=UPI00315DF854